MGKKLYRPILKEGDHLDKSRKNNNRVRGVSRDSNNKNPDIIEWEEVDVEDQSAQNVPTPSPEPEKRELTPEQQELAQIIGDALADIIIYEAERLNEAVVKPWWKNSVKPWIRERFEDIKCAVSGKKKFILWKIILQETDTLIRLQLMKTPRMMNFWIKNLIVSALT